VPGLTGFIELWQGPEGRCLPVEIDSSAEENSFKKELRKRVKSGACCMQF
jgi:hypothetical protein